MRGILWFLALFILLVIQGGILQPLNLFPVNLLLILAIVSLVFAHFKQSLVLAVASGIMLDLISGTTDGLISLSIVCVILAAFTVINFAFPREPNLLILFVTVAFSTAGYFIFFFLFNSLFNLLGLGPAYQVELGHFFLNDFPKSLVFNLLLTYPVFLYYNLINSINKKMAKNAHQPV